MGEQIPHTPSLNRPKGRGIKPQEIKMPVFFMSIMNSSIQILNYFINHNVKYIMAEETIIADGKINILRFSLIHLAVREIKNTAYLDILRKKYGENILYDCDTLGNNAFHYAAARNTFISIYEWLYIYKVKINLENKDEIKPFEFAVMYNESPDVLDWFISKDDFEFDIIHKYYVKALQYNPSENILRWFEKFEIDLSFADDVFGNTIFHFIAEFPGTQTKNIIWFATQCDDLSKYISLTNKAGKTPLDYLKNRRDWKTINKELRKYCNYSSQGLT